MIIRWPRCCALTSLLGLTLVLPACQAYDAAGARQEPGAVTATTAPAPLKYIARDAIDVRALLPDPPARGSAVEAGEVEVVLAIMRTAPPQECAQAEAEVSMTAAIFADVLGAGFDAKSKPKTFAWLAQGARDAKAISDAAKDSWSRARPFAVDHRIPGEGETGLNPSYPSGHATRAMVWAGLLGALYPDRAEALLARARVVGYHRIVLGVHFPSDVAAGNALGAAIAAKMLENDACRADMEAAKAER